MEKYVESLITSERARNRERLQEIRNYFDFSTDDFDHVHLPGDSPSPS